MEEGLLGSRPSGPKAELEAQHLVLTDQAAALRVETADAVGEQSAEELSSDLLGGEELDGCTVLQCEVPACPGEIETDRRPFAGASREPEDAIPLPSRGIQNGTRDSAVTGRAEQHDEVSVIAGVFHGSISRMAAADALCVFVKVRHGRQIFVEAQLPSLGGPSPGSGRLE